MKLAVIGALRAYGLVVGIQGVLLIYLMFAGHPSAFLPGFWARSLDSTMQMALFTAFSMEVTPAEERATANSYAMVGRNLGTAIAARWYGAAIAAGSLALSFGVAGLMAIGAALSALLLFRRRSALSI